MKLNRRHFLKGTAMCAGAAAVPIYVPASVLGPSAPSNNIHIAGIGTGMMGTNNLWNHFRPRQDVRIVAVSDCYRSRREDLARRLNDEHYGSEVCKPADDYREVLARDDVDGVVICTPDHWHVPIAYFAAKAKKHMYVEKPLSVAMAWAQKLRGAVQQNDITFQYGTQQRSMGSFRRVVNLVRNGYIGKVTHVDIWCAGMRAPGWYAQEFQARHHDTRICDVPADLNYDMWIGPAPMKPYTNTRTTNWGAYHIYDYSLGFLAGWGAHPLDAAQWGLNKDHTSPVKYEGTGALPPEGLFDTVEWWDVNCEYGDGTTMRFMSTRVAQDVLSDMDPRRFLFKEHGTLFRGEDGWICVNRDGIYASSRELQRADITDQDTPVYFSDSHAGNFIDCIKSRKPTITPFETAIRSDTISHISDICIRLKRAVRWDPIKEQILGDHEASVFLNRNMRDHYAIEGWM